MTVSGVGDQSSDFRSLISDPQARVPTYHTQRTTHKSQYIAISMAEKSCVFKQKVLSKKADCQLPKDRICIPAELTSCHDAAKNANKSYLN
jgi:hypothetical protein